MYKNMKSFGKAWVKALRSGEYKQAQGALVRYGKKHDTFCCLGVAFNMLAEKTDRYYWDESGTACSKTDFQNDCIARVAPNWMGKWLLGDDAKGYERENTLVDMNDRGRSFKEIANYIERELKL